MNEIDDLLNDSARRIFSDLCNRAQLERAEAGEWPAALWEALESNGLISALDPTADGKSLLPLPTLSVIIRALGEFAIPLPIAETLLAQRLLVRAGLHVPEGPLSVAPRSDRASLARRNGRWYFSAELRRVPWGRHAHAIVVAVPYGGETAFARVPRGQPVNQGLSVANEPRDDLIITDLALSDDCVALESAAADTLNQEASLFRSLQIIGAMGRVLAMTVDYSMERVQFGRAIAKFQAVQHQVAVMATHAAAATAAAEAAVNLAEKRPANFEIMAAKLRASEAAGVCTRVAHQVHGAMGFTYEHSLQHFTRRLLAWRDEFGSEAECAEWIGSQIQRVGGMNLWSYVSTPQFGDAEKVKEFGRA